jgi:hypothetical protein
MTKEKKKVVSAVWGVDTEPSHSSIIQKLRKFLVIFSKNQKKPENPQETQIFHNIPKNPNSLISEKNPEILIYFVNILNIPKIP